jgi:mannosyltransferase
MLAMTATAGLLAVLGARLVDRRVGVLAGLTFALVPVTSRYAQEARPYAFVLLFAVLATLALSWFLSRPGWVAGVAYAVSIALLGAFHLLALLLLVAHAIAVALPRNRRLAIGWLIASTAGVVPLLPLAWLGDRQSGQISWLTKADWRTLVATPDTIFGAGVAAGLIIGLGALAVSRKPPAVLALAWALGPILALFAIGEVTTLFWARYLLYTLPGFVLLAALKLGRLRAGHAAAILVALALVAAPAQTGIRTPDGHNHATTAAAGIIAANERAGDGIAYALDEPVVPWEARDIVARYVPAGKQPRDVFAIAPQRTGDRLAATECPDLAACLGDTPRLWVLRYENLADPLAGIGAAKATLITARFRLDRLWTVRGLTVALYVRG